MSRRLRALDQEWDTERALEAGSAVLTLAGLALALLAHPCWLALSSAAQVLFMRHALQGWCPVRALARALGVRTRGQIARERHALKALRGDYEGCAAVLPVTRSDAARALEAAGLD